MSKVWKWILGVIAVIVIVGVVVGAVFLWRSHASFSMTTRVTRQGQNLPNAPAGPGTQNGQQYGQKGQNNVPNGQNNLPGNRNYTPWGPRAGMPGWRGNGMRGYGGFGPMMKGGERGFSRFGGGFGPVGMFMPFGFGLFFLGGLLRWIIPLGVLVLVAFLFYQMGKNAGLAAAAKPAPASEPEETPRRGRRVAKK